MNVKGSVVFDTSGPFYPRAHKSTYTQSGKLISRWFEYSKWINQYGKGWDFELNLFWFRFSLNLVSLKCVIDFSELEEHGRLGGKDE